MVSLPEKEQIAPAEAVKGHNKPPSDTEWLEENLTLRHVSLIRQSEEHAALFDKIPDKFSEQLEADYVSDLIKDATFCFKELENAREEEKRPFLRQGQLVDSFFSDYKNKLSAVIDKAKKPLNAWLQAQAAAEQKRRDEEAARLRRESQAALQQVASAPTVGSVEKASIAQALAETAQKVAEAPIQTMAAARGSFSKASLKKKWTGTVLDTTQLDLERLRPYIKADHLQQAVNQFVKLGGRELRGANIVEEVEAAVK